MYYEPCVTEPEVLEKILLGQKRPKLVKTDLKMEFCDFFCQITLLDLTLICVKLKY